MIVFIFYTAKAEEIIFFSLHTFRRYIKKLLKLSFSSFFMTADLRTAFWRFLYCMFVRVGIISTSPKIFLFIRGIIYQNAQNVPVSNPNQQQFGLSPSSCLFNICLIIFRIWHVFFLSLLYSVNIKTERREYDDENIYQSYS